MLTTRHNFHPMCANIENFAATWTHKKPIKDRSNSGYDLAIASYAAMANLSDQEICDLLICHAKEQGFPIKRLEYYPKGPLPKYVRVGS